MNPIIIEVRLKERRQDMLQEAERLRLVKLYEANNPEPKGSLLVAQGNLLICSGCTQKQLRRIGARIWVVFR